MYFIVAKYNFSSFLHIFLATEIQNIQISDGDVCRGMVIPIYMIFPRLFTCPTLATNNFKVGKDKFISDLELVAYCIVRLQQFEFP